MTLQSVPCPLAACILIAAGSLASAPAVADIVDTFDANNAGWGLLNENGFFAAPWQATGGNPGGHLKSINFTPPAISAYFTSPSKYAGNQSAATALRFDMQRSSIGPVPNGPDILIRSTYGDLSRKLPMAPGTGWTNYNLSLTDPAGWMIQSGPSSTRQATLVDIRSALSRITGTTPGGPLYLRAEWNTLSGQSGSLDNVRLVGGAVGGASISNGLFNIDVQNVSGNTARGLKIVLPGNAQPSNFYTGSPSVFGTIEVIPQDPAPPPGDPGLQSIWWHGNPGGFGQEVPSGGLFHPGFHLKDGAYLADMYWTDDHGDAIENGHIHVASTDLIYNSITGEASLNLTNTLTDIYGAEITLDEMRMYIRPSPFLLAELNNANAELAAGLIPIPGATDASIPMGGVLNQTLPGTYADGQTIVFRYKTTSPTSGGEITYFAQFTIPGPGFAALASTLALFAARRRR